MGERSGVRKTTLYATQAEHNKSETFVLEFWAGGFGSEHSISTELDKVKVED